MPRWASEGIPHSWILSANGLVRMLRARESRRLGVDDLGGSLGEGERQQQQGRKFMQPGRI
tara:strand:+ start:391 stop:573 length:183 start_codon:yes stop_codon:yes gene_type:complete